MEFMFLFRIDNDETVVHIINKNEKPVTLDLNRFKEVGLKGKVLKDIISGNKESWGDSMILDKRGSRMLTSKLN